MITGDDHDDSEGSGAECHPMFQWAAAWIRQAPTQTLLAQ